MPKDFKKRYMYHVFTDYKDEYVDTLKEVKRIYRAFKKDMVCGVRLYKITETSDGVFQEDCLQACGSLPF